MKEIIKDYPNYEIYSDGRVYALPRTMVCSSGVVRNYKGKFLKPGKGSNGYYKVVLYSEGKRCTKNIHQLVAEAFLCHTPNGHDLVVHHKNDKKFPNNVDNLELISSGENIAIGFKAKGVTSKYRGVCYDKSKRRWVSYYNSKKIGQYDTELDAYNSVKHLH